MATSDHRGKEAVVRHGREVARTHQRHPGAVAEGGYGCADRQKARRPRSGERGRRLGERLVRTGRVRMRPHEHDLDERVEEHRAEECAEEGDEPAGGIGVSRRASTKKRPSATKRKSGSSFTALKRSLAIAPGLMPLQLSKASAVTMAAARMPCAAGAERPGARYERFRP